MKLISTLALLTVLAMTSASFAKGRPMPKPKPKPPIHKCPAGQKWDNSMKMCM